MKRTHFLLHGAIGGLVAVIFAVDATTPKGISIWALYMIPLLLTMWLPSPRVPIYLAGTCTGLALAGFHLSPVIISTWISVANRGIGILVMWIVALQLVKHKQTEEALRQSEARFRQMADTIQEVFWMATPNVTETVYVSPAYEKVWGRSCASLAADPQSWLEAIHPEDREHLLAALEGYQRGESQVEYRIVRPDGAVRWIWDHGYPVRNERGETVSVVGIARDITERKQADEALRESKTRLALVLEASSEGIWDWNIRTGSVYYSPRWIESLGYAPGDVPPHVGFWESIVHPDDMPLVRERLAAHFEGRTSGYECEYRRRMKSGVWLWTLDRGRVVEWAADGAPLRMVGADADISLRKTMQRRQAMEHAVTRILAESASLKDSISNIIRQVCESLEWEMGSLWLLDEEARVLRCDRLCWAPAAGGTAFETLSRQACFPCGSGLPGRVWASGELEWIQDVLNHPEFIRASAASSATLHGAMAFPIKWDGRTLGVMEFFSRERRPPDVEQMEILGTIGAQIGQFVMRKRAEEALRNSEERFRRLVDANIIGLMIADVHGHVLEANDVLLTMLGCSREELLSGLVRWDTMTPPEWRPLSEEVRREVLQDGVARPREKEYFRKDGSRVPVLLGVALVERTRGTCISFVLDLTEQKRAEEALRRYGEAIRDLYNQAPCGYHSLDAEGTFQSVNDTELAWLGYTREELVGKRRFETLLTPESGRSFRAQFSRFMERGLASGLEFEMVRKDGTTMPVLLNATAISDAGGRYVSSRFTLFDNTERKRTEEERENLVRQLQEALANVKTLKGLLSICSSCQKVRDDRGQWKDLETYVRNHSEADFHHGLCPSCGELLFPGFYKHWDNTH